MILTFLQSLKGAPRPQDACRCPHSNLPSSFLTASLVGSSTLRSPPEPPCCPEIAAVIDENFRRRCGPRSYVCCRLRSPSQGNHSIGRIGSRWSSACCKCSRLESLLFVHRDHGGGSWSRHQLGVYSISSDRQRSVR
jgi:hypothetical protein